MHQDSPEWSLDPAKPVSRKSVDTQGDAHRQGNHVAKLVAENWEAWWNLSSYAQELYWKYQDGTLLEERNEAAKAFGHGLLYNDRGEVIA